MTIDEGGALKGSLSDYISEALKDIASKQAAEAKDKQDKTPIQEPILLGIYEKLFTHFHVRELLDLVRSEYFTYSPPVKVVASGNGLELPEIEYRWVIMPVTETYIRRVVKPWDWPSSFGPGYGTTYSGGGSYEVEGKAEMKTGVSIIQSMRVTAVRSHEAGALQDEYDLEYTLREHLTEAPPTTLEGIKRTYMGMPLACRPPIDKDIILNSVRIKDNQKPEVLIKAIGYDIARVRSSRK